MLPPLFGMTCLLQLRGVTFKTTNITFLFLPQCNLLPSDMLCVWSPTAAPLYHPIPLAELLGITYLDGTEDCWLYSSPPDKVQLFYFSQ